MHFNFLEHERVNTWNNQDKRVDISCKLLPAAGSVICLPEPCETYQLDMYERCESIAADTGIILQQLLAWNPVINDFCSNLYRRYGWDLCVR